jgi:hypothetical protein
MLIIWLPRRRGERVDYRFLSVRTNGSMSPGPQPLLNTVA